ncbi:site-specific integrase [Bacillus sp. JJ634]
MKREHGLAMVEQAFEKAVKLGELAPTAAKKYVGCISNFFNTLDKIKEEGTDKKSRDAYNPKFWTAKMVDKHYDWLYKRFDGNGEKPVSGGYIEATTHAFGKLQDLVRDHGVWKNQGVDKVRVGYKGSIEERKGRLYENYERGALQSNDEKTSMKATDIEYRKLLNTIDKVIPKTDRNYETIKNAIISQGITGGRITAEINLKAGDIDLEKMTKFYDKDKNNFSRTVPMQVQQKQFYYQLTKDKADGSPLFPLFDKDGKQMSKEDASKYMQNTYKKIAEAAGLIERDENGKVTSRYTSHSTRRVFAQRLYDSTSYMKKEAIWGKIQEYVNMQGSNKEGILRRIHNEKVRLNYSRLKTGKPMKDFTWEQCRRLYCMLQMGHSRTDTLCQSYIIPDEPFYKTRRRH